MSSQALHDSLRLSATVAVVNGFAELTGLPFGLYASLAVLTVTVGNFGNTLELGRQRLIGTVVGAVVVFFGYQAWGHLPVGVALPLALLVARMVAGSLRLTVGYTVCCFVVVVGWLTHEQQLDSWIPLRLLWTAFGILLALLSLRLFWPSRSRIQQREGLLQLLVNLGRSFELALQPIRSGDGQPNKPPIKLSLQIRQLRDTLLQLREQRQSARIELGPMADQHPVAQMWELLDQACEALILNLDELRRLPAPDWQAWGLEDTQIHGLRFVEAVGHRLLRWQDQLSHSLQLQPPPQEPLPSLPLAALHTAAAQAAYERLNPEQLQRVASELMVLNRLHQTIESSERRWRDLLR